MDKEHFITHVSTLFFRTSSKNIKSGTHFKQLQEWNILLAVSLAEMVREEYQVELNEKDFLRNDTIGDLYRCIRNKQ
ncbi:phosphopantetheine-binding protein [Coprobacter sp.]